MMENRVYVEEGDVFGLIENDTVLRRNLNIDLFNRWDTDFTIEQMAAIPIDGFNLRYYTQNLTEPTAGRLLYNQSDGVITINISGGIVRINCYAKKLDLAKSWMDKISEIIPRSVSTDELLKVSFWCNGNHGPIQIVRKLSSPAWVDIEGNYAQQTQAKIEKLMTRDFTTENTSGKLILWHGVPGTGKTYALRSLLKAWREWCDPHYILDPEQFFGKDSSYMINVILGTGDLPQFDDDDNEVKPRWKMIILEDTGELLSMDAKEKSGQGLSRLLNVCDGLIGQGLRILVLITTNEDIGKLSPAVTRPGRCLSDTTFLSLSQDEVAQWAKNHGVSPGVLTNSPTVAELYAEAEGEIPDRQEVGFALHR